MLASKIKIDQEYAARLGRLASHAVQGVSRIRVTALDREGGVYGSKKTWISYVELEPRSGKERPSPHRIEARDVIGPWSEHGPEVLATEERKRKEDDERALRILRMREVLEALGVQHADLVNSPTQARIGYGGSTATLTIELLERILADRRELERKLVAEG